MNIGSIAVPDERT